jgi:hypothetical protein
VLVVPAVVAAALAVLPIGYSAESAGRPARCPLEEVTPWL